MGLQSLINQLGVEHGDTLPMGRGYPPKSLAHAACTPDTFDSPVATGTAANAYSAGVSTVDAALWCWPHSSAMNGREIDMFAARLSRFVTMGQRDAAEALADKLVLRDRESDDRRLCLECAHAGPYEAGRLCCTNWKSAGFVTAASDLHLPAVLVAQLHRCADFSDQGFQSVQLPK
jgi:hypothetical protein